MPLQKLAQITLSDLEAVWSEAEIEPYAWTESPTTRSQRSPYPALYEIQSYVAFEYECHYNEVSLLLSDSQKAINVVRSEAAKRALSVLISIASLQSSLSQGISFRSQVTPPVNNPPLTEEQIRARTVGELQLLAGTIPIVDYDPQWPELFEREAGRIRTALGRRVLRIEHTGSTSVPGLVAKPIIDVLLVVTNSGDEGSYVPALEAAGYLLRIRETNWYEHRMFNGPDTEMNLHVFSSGCPEIDRMLTFRDWLRSHDADRDLYARTKLALAQKEWEYVQNYADAKTAVIEEIIARARSIEK